MCLNTTHDIFLDYLLKRTHPIALCRELFYDIFNVLFIHTHDLFLEIYKHVLVVSYRTLSLLNW